MTVGEDKMAAIMYLLLLVIVMVDGQGQKNSSDVGVLLNIEDFDLSMIPVDMLRQQSNIKELYLSGNDLKYITEKDFQEDSTKKLRYLDLSDNLIYGIHEEAFTHMNYLEAIDLTGNKFTDIPIIKAPNLKTIYLNKNQINRLSHRILFHYRNLEHLELKDNEIQELMPLTFSGNKKLNFLDLSENPLQLIHQFSLTGPMNLKTLLLRRTEIISLPNHGINNIQVLDIRENPDLLEMPEEKYFKKLQKIDVTFVMHCCSFEKRSNHKGHDHGGVGINCKPTPDAFNPCENILDPIRVLSWILAIIVIVGNILLLTVLYRSKQNTVHRMLMLNFSFGNLLIGFYLLVLCCIDAHTYGEYYDFAVSWQYKGGCKTIGFMVVFASSLSLCSLILITVERFVITNFPLTIDRQQVMRYATILIVLAWIYSFIMALLPATDAISSFSKTAICLPLDIDKTTSEGYVIWLLAMYVVAFVAIVYLYVRIFKNIKAAESENDDVLADNNITKRLAVVIFSNFVFWLPISITSFLCMYGNLILNAEVAKILLIIFISLNAAISPVIYAFLTKRFQEDTRNLFNKQEESNLHEEDEYRNRASSYFKSIFHGGKARSETKTSVILHCQQPTEGQNSISAYEQNVEVETNLNTSNPMSVIVDSNHHHHHLQQFSASPNIYREERSDSTRGLLEDYRKQHIQHAGSFETAVTLKTEHALENQYCVKTF